MVAACQSAWTYGNLPFIVSPPPPSGSQCDTSSHVGDIAVPFSVRALHKLPPTST